MDAVEIRPTAIRGAATRDALLDAAESLIADHGYAAPSHRMIAGQAGTHVALVNYHFGSKELLFEGALERRAGRLNERWRRLLAALRETGSWTVGDVLRAWWRPFVEFEPTLDPPWGNYLCTFARLADATQGEAWYERYFGVADRDFLQAFAQALPEASPEDLQAGFRYARSLFATIMLHRCGKTGSDCRPRGYREDDLDRALRYVEAGMRGIASA